MRARLFARFGPEEGLEVEFGGEATIGRGQDNTVLLSSREVSQHHARVFYDPEATAYWVEDLDSLNGTSLDGTPVSGRERLGGLHLLSFGATAELFFLLLDSRPEEPEAAVAKAPGTQTQVDDEAPTLPVGLRPPATRGETRVDAEVPTLPPGLQSSSGDAPGEAKPGSATRVEAAPAELPASLADGERAAQATPGRFVLEVFGEPQGRFSLREGENLVGRSGRAHVVLRNRELSRRHATLRVAGDRVWLRDEGSRNQTFVAGREISGEVELEPGSELRFGLLEARLSLAEPATEEEES